MQLKKEKRKEAKKMDRIVEVRKKLPVSGLLGISLIISLMILNFGCSKKTGQTTSVETKEDGQASIAKATSAMPVGQTAASDRKSGTAGEVEKPSCLTFIYKHKRDSAHSSDEVCSGHRNLIRIANQKINARSICARVDGTPVAFQIASKVKDGTHLVIGPVVGPDSKVSVSFCEGNAKCKEKCVVPKDQFLQAIGGDTGIQQVNAKWDPNDKENNDDVNQELDDEIKRELADDSDLPIFDGWIIEKEAASCRVQ
ncbi:MAG: hypothetical protein A3K03_05625 [Bdellovibrionales bacterium RIFOXYD1_FULL_44_7]|nr:MAG: hypothetical protein A3K03_05625 [Bdellovibrionales bacterium RIFOXYD1_FULL_44_7]